ncbi:MAG: gliding motility-associated C-terminal domain-containing protein [Phaeodactylibacter sp.]|nr:gliding motility-associated C-terminal domain-containing protein [Phaeodactylibacter sp.]
MNTFTCWLLLLLSANAWQNNDPSLACNLTVNAGPDQTICNPGQPVNLNANVNGQILNVSWSPSTGLSNPNSPNPTATVNTTTTYTVTVNGASNQNQMLNGDFSQGFTNFTSNYVPGTGGPFGLLSAEGTYAVSTNPALTHTNFSSFGDISGDGNMLVVNGAGVANQAVLCQTVSVTPNTNYAFSTWVASAISNSPAQLQFSANGQLLGGIFSASPTPGQWDQFYAVWNSGGSNSATICIVNQNTALSGNDFCLDGMFFSELCQATDQVTITVVQLNADFNPPTGLCVASPPVNLNSLLSPQATPGGTWRVNGIPTSIFDPSQWGAGIHNITYTVSSGPCTETLSLPIIVEPLPQALWFPPAGLCETSPVANMNAWLAPGSLPGGFWTINGSPSNGQFNPSFWGPGLHFVSYTAGTPPCLNDFMEFVEVSALPSANFTAPPEVCAQSGPILLNSWLEPGSSSGGTWTVNGVPATVLDPETLGPGVYDIIYEVGTFPCQGIDQGTVIINAVPAPVPTCGPSTSNSITVNWPAVPGASGYSVQILSGQAGGSVAGTSFTLGGLSPGETVELIVLAEDGSGCPGTPSNPIQCATLSCIAPEVVIAPEPPRCADAPAFNLSVTVADTLPDGVWSGPGIVDAIAGTFDPAVAGAGLHTVQFVTSSGDCPGQGEVELEVLPIPVAAFTLPDTICVSDTALIEFTGIADPAAAFTWDFGGGSSAAAPNDTLQPVRWSTPGQKIVSLQIEQDGCLSELFADTILVQPLLQPPLMNCRSTENSVEFFWNPNLAVDSFLVTVLTPQGGTMVSDTSFLVDDLTPGDTVEISVTAFSTTACPDTMVFASCIAEACPDITLDIATVPDICLDADTAPITLSATLSGGPADGAFLWQGPGITDGPAGLFDPEEAGAGMHAINLTYTRGSCSYSASASITVLPTPVATFTAASPICLDGSSEVAFTGSAGNTAAFDWDFDGGAATPADTFDVQWAAPGSYTIQLQIEEAGCTSDIYAQTVQVADTLTTPAITCEATYTSVTFTWNRTPNAFAYSAVVTDGPAGTIISDTSLLVGGLQPGQSVSIGLTALSPTVCPSVTATATCAALPCPDVSLAIQPPADQCFGGSPFEIPLGVDIINDTGNGAITWSGAGIADPNNGRWRVNAGQVGQPNPIVATWTEDVCVVTDTAWLTVFANPTAGFTATPVICVEGQATVEYTGTATPNATYNWDFGGGAVISGSGAGPYQVQWDNPGNYTISLQAEENGCSSEMETQSVTVDDILTPPAVQCEATYTSVLFSWNDTPNASSHQVQVTDGPQGNMLSNNSYLIAGLQPGQEVSIELTTLSANACPAVSTNATCAALPCPNVILDIQPPADQCFGGTAFDIDLDINILNDTGNGTLSWSGAGITNPNSARWTVDGSQIGQPNAIIATWTEDVCVVADTAFLTVFANPTADFTATPVICVEGQATVEYAGTATPAATYNWDFNGGTVVSGSGAGPYQVQWDNPGNYTVSLQVEENGCSSETETQPVTVDDILTPPAIQCEATYTTVLFTWNDTPNAASYQVQVTDGPQGSMLSDNSYLISGLQPGQQASIELTTLSANACPAVSASATCAALPCPDVTLAIQPPADQCFGGTAFDIALDINILNDTGNGTLSWSGTGISNPNNPVWTVEGSQVGQPNPIIATWTEDVCVVADTAWLTVFANPTADFTATPLICVEGQATVAYTGTATPGATYNWDFDGGTVISGSGAGPYQVQWPAAGNYTVSLQVEENGCFSEPFAQSVQADPLLQAPAVVCQPSFGSVLFTWSPVANASGYQASGAGAMLSDTSYLVEGLLPGEEATITVAALSANACPAVSTEASCNGLLCPDATVSLSVTPFLCAGGEAQLDITFFGDGGPYDLTLLIGGQPTALSGIEEGYTLTLPLTQTTLFSLQDITDAGHPNCSLPSPPSVTAVVRQPVTAGTPGDPFELCSRTNTNIQLSSLLEGEQSGGAWSFAGGPALLPGSFNPASGSFLPGQQPAGTYLFTYNVEAQAPCPNDSARVRVIIEERPVADAGEDITLSCTFNVGSLGGSGTSMGPGLQHHWTSEDDVDIMNPIQPFIDVSQPGTYELTVLNTLNGCSDTDQAVVDSEIAFLVPHASVSPISCFQSNDGIIAIDSVNGGTPPYRYSLNGGPFGGSASFLPLGPGVYDIVVQDATGCQAELQFQLAEPDEMQVVLFANFPSEDNVIQVGDSILVQALVNIPAEQVGKVFWQPDSLGCDTCLTAIFAPRLSTYFSVLVTDVNGCSAEDRELVVVNKQYNVYIPNVFSPNGDGANDRFMIFAGKEVKEVQSFKVFTRWGEPVFEDAGFQPNNPAHGWDGTFRGQPMNNAVFAYFAEIEMVDGQVVVFKGDVVLMR